MKTTSSLRSGARRQRGVATLVVVMLLFFVVSLVAAYASRNLIFEQRTSANQYRSTQSFEAAEGGLEWALTMLNSGRIGADCLPTTDTTQDSFRQRYLITDPATGVVTRNPAAATNPARWAAACSFTGGSWQCTCPAIGAAPFTAASLPVDGPAFGVRFVSVVAKPGMVRVEINGCSSFDMACITGANGSVFQEGLCRSTLCSIVALHSGAKALPLAAVTARGTIVGASLSASNGVVETGGITLHAGGAINVATETLSTVPGSPPDRSKRENSTALSGIPDYTADCTQCLFASVFGLRPQTYRDQPGALQLDCSAAACTAAAVINALDTARGRIVWLRGAGGLTISSAADSIGSALEPVVLVLEGPLTITAGATSNARIHGLIYAATAAIDSGEIHGALISGGNVVGNGNALVTYDADVLRRLKLTSGSYVRVPGAWRDFQ